MRVVLSGMQRSGSLTRCWKMGLLKHRRENEAWVYEWVGITEVEVVWLAWTHRSILCTYSVGTVHCQTARVLYKSYTPG